jgi:hypothetical protein
MDLRCIVTDKEKNMLVLIGFLVIVYLWVSKMEKMNKEISRTITLESSVR